MSRSLFALASCAFALSAHAQTQQSIPIVALPASSAKTAEPLMAVLGIREVAGGKVLINDAGRRQLKLFDTTLATFTVTLDSTSGITNAYGPARVPLLPYLGDSSLFADLPSSTLRVIGPNGLVARSISLPNPRDLGAFAGASSSVDSKGRLLYRGPVPMAATTPLMVPLEQRADSAPILRADLDTRAIDTIGRVKQRDGAGVFNDQSDPAKPKFVTTINPLPSLDEWAVLSNGSIALIRGFDYHIDFIHPDGSKNSTGKLPFDWKRLTDEDKQGLIDSAKAAAEAAAAQRAAAGPGAAGGRGGGDAAGRAVAVTGAVAAGGGMRGGGAGGPGGPPPQMVTVYLPLDKITDYYPAIRPGAAMADRDGNLWILPTTSGRSQSGELVYDVINVKGELYQRVRLPLGRSIAGFGKGGVIYMMSGDRTNGFFLERTRLSLATKVAVR